MTAPSVSPPLDVSMAREWLRTFNVDTGPDLEEFLKNNNLYTTLDLMTFLRGKQ